LEEGSMFPQSGHNLRSATRGWPSEPRNPGPEAGTMAPRTPLIVGVAGGSAAGKSTLVEGLRAFLPDVATSLLHQDDYYRDNAHLPQAERAGLDYDRPEALDNRRLVRDLRALRDGRAVECPVYCFATHTRRPETRSVEPRDVLLVEGMLILSVPELRELMDVAVYVEAPDEVRLARRVDRDVGPERRRAEESVREQWAHSVLPGHRRYVEPSKALADIVVTDATDHEQVATVADLVRRSLVSRD